MIKAWKQLDRVQKLMILFGIMAYLFLLHSVTTA